MAIALLKMVVIGIIHSINGVLRCFKYLQLVKGITGCGQTGVTRNMPQRTLLSDGLHAHFFFRFTRSGSTGAQGRLLLAGQALKNEVIGYIHLIIP